jgi:hypothetical protein
VKGIEPSCPAWEAGVLPLNYTRNRIADFGLLIGDLQAGINSIREITTSETATSPRTAG